jgi:hypothetical protein
MLWIQLKVFGDLTKVKLPLPRTNFEKTFSKNLGIFSSLLMSFKSLISGLAFEKE